MINQLEKLCQKYNQTHTGWNEIKLYPLNDDIQVKHYYKYNLKQTTTRSLDDLDTLIKIAILP